MNSVAAEMHAWTLARRTVMVGVAVGLCCWLSIRFTRLPGGFSMLWPAGGVLCGILLTSARRDWPAYIAAAGIANLLAHILVGDGPVYGSMLMLAGLIEAVAVAFALSRYVGDVID